MPTDSMTGIKKMFKQKGGPAMRNARKKINSDFSADSVSSQALRYFSEVTLDKALPVFPALVALSCKAVGGDIKETVLFGESMILTSAGADIHDDVIDQSLMKGTKLTIFGKFNTAMAILAGDILLFQGFKQLTEASGAIPEEKAKEIVKLFLEAVTEICAAEALEMQLHNKTNITPEDLLAVIKLKAVVPELCTKNGAIIGNGDSKSVKILGAFGRIYGINGSNN